MGEDLILLQPDESALIEKTLNRYMPFGQVVTVDKDRLPKRVSVMWQCEKNGLINDSPDIPIEPEELPKFPDALKVASAKQESDDGS